MSGFVWMRFYGCTACLLVKVLIRYIPTRFQSSQLYSKSCNRLIVFKIETWDAHQNWLPERIVNTVRDRIKSRVNTWFGHFSQLESLRETCTPYTNKKLEKQNRNLHISFSQVWGSLAEVIYEMNLAIEHNRDMVGIRLLTFVCLLFRELLLILYVQMGIINRPHSYLRTCPVRTRLDITAAYRQQLRILMQCIWKALCNLLSPYLKLTNYVP